MDYGTLKTTIASYLHRDDLTATIPTFIQFAQSRMSHDLDVTSMHNTATLTVTAGTNTVALPTDGFLGFKSVRIPYAGGYRTLQQHSLVQNSQTLESYGGASGAPKYYARYGSTLELTPTPEEDTTLEVVYKRKIQAFTSDTDTDDLLTNYPNIYVYASMIEAMPFIKDASVKWEELYALAAAKLNDLADQEEWSGAPMQILNLGVDTP